MLNTVILVGKLVNEIDDEGKIIIANNRPFENEDGVYETDFIPCIITGDIKNNVAEYCKKGDTIGIKGRIETKDNVPIIKVERVTFLSTKKEEK